MIATAPTSDIASINAAIECHNPFAQPPFVSANNVWGESFPDVKSLNSHASDAVFETLNQIRSKQCSTVSILITAQNGTGKSHLLSRIRHRLQSQGGALFILVSKLDDINDVDGSFQLALSSSLSNIGSEGVQQWQELATCIVNGTLKAEKSDFKEISPKYLIKKFDITDENKVKRLVKEISKKFCKYRSVNDPDVVKAILWTLSEEQSSYASNWLAGKELAQYKSNELLLPPQRKSLDTVIEILDLISDYKELIICFDDLDVLKFSESGLHKSQEITNLNNNIFQNMRRGVLLSVMMPGTWNERIKQQLPGGISSRMTTYGKPIELQYMDGDSVIELVTYSLAEYFRKYELVSPDPLYPFDESVLREIGREKLTVREVLQWCKENCKVREDVQPGEHKKLDPVEEAFISELEEARQADLDNSKLIGDALRFSFELLGSREISGVKLHRVTERVKNDKQKDPYLNFKITGEENGKVCIGVAVLQHDGGKALGAGFRRLLDTKEEFGLTRGCLIRSKEKSMSNSIKKNYLDPLIQNQGGEFVSLNPEEIYPLIAIYSVALKRDSEYGLTEAQISEFITQHGAEKMLGEHNPLLREILSDPSHQVPELAEEPETDVGSSGQVNEPTSEPSDVALTELMVANG